MASNTAVISVRDLVVGFGETPVLDRATLDVFEGEILGFVGGSGAGKSVLMRTIIGLLPKRNGSIEVFGSRPRGRQRRRAARDRAALGRAVPAGRAVLLAHGAAERAVPDPRISQALAAPDRGDRAGQTGNGRAQRQCARQISVRAVRRHGQARRAGPRAGARSRHRFPRRADLGPRSDRRRRVRRT